MKTRKFLIIAFILCFLIVLYSYICSIDSIPKNTILFEGEELKIKTIFGISLKTNEDNSILTSVNTEKHNNNYYLGTKNVKVKLFDLFTVKDINVSYVKRTKVIPVGQIGGLKLYTNGVLVVGITEIKGKDNKTYKPYENSGIKEGDIITEVEGKKIKNTKELIKLVNNSKGEKIKIKYVKNNKEFECKIKPTKINNKEYKLGLWVRDSAAGIGTISFYEPETKKIAALGHGISDIDTGELINISNGEFITTKIVSIIKGKKGKPGKIQGIINNQKNIGQIIKNTNLGIYGIVNNNNLLSLKSKKLDVASRNEIKLGNAKILCTLNNNQINEYDIEIEKIFLNNDYDNKSMLIKVTDKELLNKTGGIIQGMSGAPIIQNNKFIGSITNVLVNDPTRGYGLFGDLMLKEMDN